MDNWNKPKPICMYCKDKITDEEFEYEDYFTVYRGTLTEGETGYLCFACVRESHKPFNN